MATESQAKTKGHLETLSDWLKENRPDLAHEFHRKPTAYVRTRLNQITGLHVKMGDEFDGRFLAALQGIPYSRPEFYSFGAKG